jgi:hypothetical protein
MARPSSNLGGTPGEYDDAAASSSAGLNSDLWFDSANGSFSGPETVREGTATPTFEEGEVWALKIRCTLSSENTSDAIFLELMDEGENYFIQKAGYDTYTGHDAEINTIVDYPTASNDGAAASPSPDIRLTVVGGDGGNYFIDVIGKRLKKARDVSLNTYPFTTAEDID